MAKDDEGNCRFTHTYRYVILSDPEFKKSKGIPAIAGENSSFFRIILSNIFTRIIMITER